MSQTTVPPGRCAGGQRSPIVWVRLCAGCAGFAPSTSEDYNGFLSGHCQGCGSWNRELHLFPAYIDSVSGCNQGRCAGRHDRVHGDLSVGPGLREEGDRVF